MTNTTVNAPAAPGVFSTVKRAVTSVFNALGRGFVAFGQARARSDELNRLNAMSDLKLASLGLRRENIARHVFRDLFVD